MPCGRYTVHPLEFLVAASRRRKREREHTRGKADDDDDNDDDDADPRGMDSARARAHVLERGLKDMRARRFVFVYLGWIPLSK